MQKELLTQAAASERDSEGWPCCYSAGTRMSEEGSVYLWSQREESEPQPSPSPQVDSLANSCTSAAGSAGGRGELSGREPRQPRLEEGAAEPSLVAVLLSCPWQTTGGYVNAQQQAIERQFAHRTFTAQGVPFGASQHMRPVVRP